MSIITLTDLALMPERVGDYLMPKENIPGKSISCESNIAGSLTKGRKYKIIKSSPTLKYSYLVKCDTGANYAIMKDEATVYYSLERFL